VSDGAWVTPSPRLVGDFSHPHLDAGFNLRLPPPTAMCRTFVACLTECVRQLDSRVTASAGFRRSDTGYAAGDRWAARAALDAGHHLVNSARQLRKRFG
jgi:hypothetical protein